MRRIVFRGVFMGFGVEGSERDDRRDPPPI